MSDLKVQHNPYMQSSHHASENNDVAACLNKLFSRTFSKVFEGKMSQGEATNLLATAPNKTFFFWQNENAAFRFSCKDANGEIHHVELEKDIEGWTTRNARTFRAQQDLDAVFLHYLGSPADKCQVLRREAVQA